MPCGSLVTPNTHLLPPELLLANVKWIHAIQQEQFSAEIAVTVTATPTGTTAETISRQRHATQVWRAHYYITAACWL